MLQRTLKLLVRVTGRLSGSEKPSFCSAKMRWEAVMKCPLLFEYSGLHVYVKVTYLCMSVYSYAQLCTAVNMEARWALTFFRPVQWHDR